VAAPAVSGAANQSLVRLIAAELDVPRGSVRLVAGASGRTKLIVVERVPPADILARWPGLQL
jgi:uncharacterized protein